MTAVARAARVVANAVGIQSANNIETSKTFLILHRSR